jgi:hypothetical protein
LDAPQPVILAVRPGFGGWEAPPMPLREHAFLYVDCDVPDGVTLDSWRSAKAPAPRRRRLDGLMRRGRPRTRTDGQAAHESGATRE